MPEWNYLRKILWSSTLVPIGWSFSCDPSGGSQLDLLQVELTSFLATVASGASFLGREPEQETKSLVRGLRPAPIKSD